MHLENNWLASLSVHLAGVVDQPVGAYASGGVSACSAAETLLFLNNQKREDAEKALKALDGLALHGMEMHIGWGKAVPLPPVPLYSGVGVPTGPLTGMLLC